MVVKTILLVLVIIYSCYCDIECSYESEDGVFYDFTNLKWVIVILILKIIF